MRLLVFALSGIIAFAGCGGGTETAARTPVDPPESIAVFYTCDTRGNLDPCNCPQGAAGGMARRSAFLQERATEAALIVDAGNVTHGPLEHEVFEMEHILKCYAAMGYDAVNLGAREMALPPDTLKDMASRYPFLISTNVRDANGAPLLPASMTVTLPGGYTAGILGVVQDNVPADLIAEGLTILPPAEAIAATLPNLTAQSDFVVVLAYVNQDTMQALADQFFEIGLIVGGDVQQPSAEAQMANRSLLVFNTDKGKNIGALEIGFAGGNAVPLLNEITMLLEPQSGTADVAALMETFRIERTNKGYPVREDTEAEHTAVSPAGG